MEPQFDCRGRVAGGRSPYGFVADFVASVQGSGRLTFSVSDIALQTSVAGANLQAALLRHAATGAITRISRKADFFVIVPPEYRALGAPPVEWWLGDLMGHSGLSYYLGLLSAAEAHGSAHFAVMETQVVTSRWLRPLEIGRTRLRFFAKSDLLHVPTENRHNQWGTVAVSEPEPTVLDLLRYRPCGIERTAMILADLARSFRKDRLVQSLNAADDTPSAQRLGYLLERHGASRSADVVKAWLVGHHPRKVDLEVGGPSPWEDDIAWHIRVNSNLEAAS